MKKKIVGYDNERKELKELSEMLRNVKRYRDIGVRIPRGLVLYGEPGVGKSVMARSIAGNGIKSIELRAAECCMDNAEKSIRDVFEKAKKSSPCVLILDELDKIAGTSHHFFMATNADVNKVLLQEIDSLTEDDYVLVVATCNDTECLGEALLRAGRFDRQIKVNLPNEETRVEILKYYLSKVKLNSNLDVEYVAKITYGRSCADLECIVNEAAIEVIQKGSDIITLENIRMVINKMVFDGAPEKPMVDKDNIYKTAIHEAGHSIVAIKLLPNNIHGASIIPQGDSSGHIEFVGSGYEIKSLREYQSEIAVLLAGRVAEREVLKELYLGSRSDMRKAMQIALELITKQGISGYRYIVQQSSRFSESRVSNNVLYEIELEIEKLMNEADALATKIIRDNYDKFNEIIKLLQEKQVLSREELLSLS